MRTPLAVIAVFVGNAAIAQTVNDNPIDQCKDEQAAISAVSTRYKSSFDQYEKEGNDLKNSDEAANFKFKVTWDNTEIRFGTPSVTVKDKRIVFGVPQVTMKLNEIVFHTPSIRMERVKTGQYPEFYCEDTWIKVGPIKTKGVPSCTTKWSDMFADVPKPFMQEQRIKLHIPEFKWADTEIIMGIPEFFLQQQRIVMGLPQFKLDSVVINPGALKDKSENLSSKIADTRSQMVTETGGAIHNVYSCYKKKVVDGRVSVSSQFDTGLSQLDGVIQSIKLQGGDPSKLVGTDGKSTDLLAARADLLSKRDAALKTFDDTINGMDQQEREAIAKMTSS